MKTAEVSRAPTTTRAAEAFFQPKTDLKQLHVRQYDVAWPLSTVTPDRIIFAEQTNIQRADCAVKVVVEYAY